MRNSFIKVASAAVDMATAALRNIHCDGLDSLPLFQIENLLDFVRVQRANGLRSADEAQEDETRAIQSLPDPKNIRRMKRKLPRGALFGAILSEYMPGRIDHVVAILLARAV